MTRPDGEVVFALSRADITRCAREMGMPPEAITDDVLKGVAGEMERDGGWWKAMVKDAINYALKS